MPRADDEGVTSGRILALDHRAVCGIPAPARAVRYPETSEDDQ